MREPPEKCETFYCDECQKLEYNFDFFPKCDHLYVFRTPYEKLYNLLKHDFFIKLINADSNFKFELIIASMLTGDVNFDSVIKPLLKDKTMTREALEYKYRGATVGEKYNF